MLLLKSRKDVPSSLIPISLGNVLTNPIQQSTRNASASLTYLEDGGQEFFLVHR